MDPRWKVIKYAVGVPPDCTVYVYKHVYSIYLSLSLQCVPWKEIYHWKYPATISLGQNTPTQPTNQPSSLSSTTTTTLLPLVLFSHSFHHHEFNLQVSTSHYQVSVIHTTLLLLLQQYICSDLQKECEKQSVRELMQYCTCKSLPSVAFTAHYKILFVPNFFFV